MNFPNESLVIISFLSTFPLTRKIELLHLFRWCVRIHLNCSSQKHGAELHCAVFTSTNSLKSFEFVGHSKIPHSSKPADKQSFPASQTCQEPKGSTDSGFWLNLWMLVCSKVLNNGNTNDNTTSQSGTEGRAQLHTLVIGIEGVFNPSVCGLLMLPPIQYNRCVFCLLSVTKKYNWPPGNICLSSLDPKAKFVRSVFVTAPELWSCLSVLSVVRRFPAGWS